MLFRLPVLISFAMCAGCSDISGPSQGPVVTTSESRIVMASAVVVFAFQGFPDDTMRVLVEDEDTIRKAEAYIATGQGESIPGGPIVRGSKYDPRYPYHFKPDSVRIAGSWIEVCDNKPMHSAEEVDAFIGAGNQSRTWCPWTAYPIRVIREVPTRARPSN